MQRKRYYYIIAIQYLGFRFHGWQKQPEVNTVQRMVERTLSYVLEHKKFKVLEASGNISTGYTCCTTLGTVVVQRVPVSNANQGEYNCKGSCCFRITTAYDVDSNDNALTKINTVSGSSCTR